MKAKNKAIQLIEKGLTLKTVSKLTESQIDILHKKMVKETITQTNTPTYNIPTDDVKKGVTLPPAPTGKKMTIQQTPTGIKATPTEEMTEDDLNVDVSKDPDATEDGMGMFEEKKNPWAICTAQLGKEFGTTERSDWTKSQSAKYERCVKDVKKSLKEGKNPVSLFIENEITKIVEKHIPPRITKGDLMKFLTEQNPSTAPAKPATKPTTKPGKPATRPRPSHPGKNPNPGENPAPKARKVNSKKAKDEVIDLIMNLLQK